MGNASQAVLMPPLLCLLRYYRANYLIVLELACFVAFIRRPLALLAVVLGTVACLLQNDSFAKFVRWTLRHCCHAPRCAFKADYHICKRYVCLVRAM